MTSHEFSEEELRALEAEMDRITVDDVLLQTVVSLINLGARKAGLGRDEESSADLDQTRQAIEGARALLPLLEQRHADKLGQVREALSRLQMAYVQQAGARPAEAGKGAEGQPSAPSGGEPPPQPPGGGGPGPAQRSGRLWVPGQ